MHYTSTAAGGGVGGGSLRGTGWGLSKVQGWLGLQGPQEELLGAHGVRALPRPGPRP